MLWFKKKIHVFVVGVLNTGFISAFSKELCMATLDYVSMRQTRIHRAQLLLTPSLLVLQHS